MEKNLNVEKTEPTRKGKMSHISEILENQLKEITRKKALADNREIFLSRKNSILEFKKEIQEELKEGHFESQSYKINLASGDYRSENKISINNVNLIIDFINMLDVKIDEYVNKIEQELIQ